MGCGPSRKRAFVRRVTPRGNRNENHVFFHLFYFGFNFKINAVWGLLGWASYGVIEDTIYGVSTVDHSTLCVDLLRTLADGCFSSNYYSAK